MTFEQAINYLQAVAATVQGQLDKLPDDKVSLAMNTIRKIDEVMKDMKSLAS